MLSQTLLTHLEHAAAAILEESGSPIATFNPITIEQPSRMEHGDYSTNIALQLARSLRKAPLHIAEQIKTRLEEDGMFAGLVNKIEVLPPGFINLFINWTVWAQQDMPVSHAHKTKIVIEHTSINPNKSSHIGHLRNACIGDTLVRMLQRTGCTVEVHNYIDDLGNQLADTVVGMLHTPIKHQHDRFGDFCWDLYAHVNKQYEQDMELQQQRSHVLHALEEGNNNLAWTGMLVAERIVREHIEEMGSFGICYDLLVWESNIVREGFWNSAFELLQQTDSFYQIDKGKLAGCWVLRQSEHEPQGDGASTPDDTTADSEHHQDKVLVRSNGILTYTAKDIAYHLWKFGLLNQDFTYSPFTNSLWTTRAGGTTRSYGHADVVINVIDYRQQYPQAMVKQALQTLGFTAQAEKLHHVSYGVVSLSPNAASELGMDTSDGRSSYAMSGRQGIGIKSAQLLDLMEKVITDKRSDQTGMSSRDIAAAAIRYYLLRFNLQTEVVLDLQQATEITGNTGVYVMYAHARATTLLQRAAQEHRIEPTAPKDISHLEKAEYALLRHIAKWPDTLQSACKELAPNTICTYAFELATLFNNFYAVCPILKASRESQVFRVWLTAKFKETLCDALQVLGLPTPERM
ncbi:arginine--tRNA ligase [Paenibacillus sp. ACRRX]|uniref:arginine--tRNA ligase n=1 Tax=Paenibacillus sp. ACRRX TaxID=2918206 RepID=UPI001EF56BE4|nr:arginine--tRNA ligase [Paenibacillus sp. ACRRX]MCG7409098.1 arginine--tRNA ligase [Paenibacillus sp. ACRRX]